MLGHSAVPLRLIDLLRSTHMVQWFSGHLEFQQVPTISNLNGSLFTPWLKKPQALMVSEHPDVKSCGQAMLQALGEVPRQKPDMLHGGREVFQPAMRQTDANTCSLFFIIFHPI